MILSTFGDNNVETNCVPIGDRDDPSVFALMNTDGSLLTTIFVGDLLGGEDVISNFSVFSSSRIFSMWSFRID